MRWRYVGRYGTNNGIHWSFGSCNDSRFEPMFQIFLPQLLLSDIDIPIFECGQVERRWAMHSAFRWRVEILNAHWHRADDGFPGQLSHSLIIGIPGSTPNLCLQCGCQPAQSLSPYGHIQQVHISRDGELVSSRSLICPFNITIKVRR